MAEAYRVLGIMSGSSLDGVDMALCRFRRHGGTWTFEVPHSTTIAYPDPLVERIRTAMESSALDLARLDRDLGDFLGEAASNMLSRTHGADLIVSHGHTVFHRPEEHLTTYIGSGACIAAKTGIPTVVELRTLDVAHGGQGAPLVPKGEQELFPGYDAFLNLGGIANVSIHTKGRVTGFDVCICNQALNELALCSGKPFDAGGELARQGKLNGSLLHALNALPFLAQPPPRSLGREWYEKEVRPLLFNDAIGIPDALRTMVEHVAIQVGTALTTCGSVLCTGGGTHNVHLMERIEAHTQAVVSKPEIEIIDQKEAIVFAFLGLLRQLEEPNTLASVTGARKDLIAGVIHLPN